MRNLYEGREQLFVVRTAQGETAGAASARELSQGASWPRASWMVGAILAALLLLWLTMSVQAAPDPSGDVKGVNLPPRPTLTPTPTLTLLPTSTVTPAPSATPVQGASIRLRVLDAGQALRSGVQWQDTQGGWHNVDAWQADLSSGGQSWWVAPWHFGTGPYRWVVYSGDGEALVAVSESFFMPNEVYGSVETLVSLSTP